MQKVINMPFRYKKLNGKIENAYTATVISCKIANLKDLPLELINDSTEIAETGEFANLQKLGIEDKCSVIVLYGKNNKLFVELVPITLHQKYAELIGKTLPIFIDKYEYKNECGINL